MRHGPAAVGRPAVSVDPLGRCLWHALPVLVAWLVVVRGGRVVCLVAQRLPPVVLAVRAVRSRLSARRVTREAAVASSTE